MTSQPTATSQAATIAGWSIWIAVLVILAALLAIILPVVAGIAVTLIIGWVLLMVGVLHLVYAFGGRFARTRLWELLLGIVYILAGGYILFHPLLGLTTLTLLLAIYLLVKGVLELIQYFQTHPRRGLTWLILDGIINIVPRSHHLEPMALQLPLGHRHPHRHQHPLQRSLPPHAVDGSPPAPWEPRPHYSRDTLRCLEDVAHSARTHCGAARAPSAQKLSS